MRKGADLPRTALPDSTLALLRDGYEFIGKRCCRYGSDAFRTRIMLEDVICMTGVEAVEVFYGGDRFDRRHAVPVTGTMTGTSRRSARSGQAASAASWPGSACCRTPWLSLGKNPMDSDAASPDQLEREIAQTRAEIDRKLNLIQQRLSPRRVAGQVANSMGAQGGAFARNLGATLRDNPVPALLLGVGICWLMLAGRNSRGYAEGGRYAEDEGADDYAEDAQDEALAQSAHPDSAAPRTAAALAAAEAERAHAAQGYEGRLHGDGTLGVAAGRR